MTEMNRPPIIYSPSSLQELLKIYRNNKDAMLYGGGTWTLRNRERNHFNLKGPVINIMAVEELKKISRTDRYLELGAGVSIGRILALGKSIISGALYKALRDIGPPHIRNMATIGGNLCVSNKEMNLYPVLHLYDAQIELRSEKENQSPRRLLKGESRWLSASRFMDSDGNISIRPSEILTRIRIPNENWKYQTYSSTGGIDSPLVFIGLAETDKYVLTDLRIGFGTKKMPIIRSREIESDLIGRRMPLPRKEIMNLNQKLTKLFEIVDETDFTKARAIGFTRAFIEKISIDEIIL